jgi:hypothetical protein
VGGASNTVSIDEQAVGVINDIKVGSNGTLTSITAPVYISQTPGARIALTINDANDASSRIVTITNSKVTFSGLSATVNFQGVTLYSLLIEDPWYQSNTIDLLGLPAGINGVTIYDKDSYDNTGITPATLVADIWFTHPPNWGAVIPLPVGVILINPDGTNLGLM